MISIIVPIYKVEKFIRQCIESIIAQTYSDIEIILVDDGSPDNCPAICDEYAKQDGRIKVVHKVNGGLVSARRAGLKAAKGDYVGFVDGDDWIEPDMYENFAQAINKYSPDMLICEFKSVYSDKTVFSNQSLEKEFYDKTSLEKEIYPKMLFKDTYYQFGIFPCCWSKLFKKEILEKNLYNFTSEIKMGEDAAFTYPCLLAAKSLAYIGKTLYNYRQDSASMSNAYDEKMADTILIPYYVLKNCFAGYDEKYKLNNQLAMYLFYLLNILIRNESSKQNKKNAACQKGLFKDILSRDGLVKEIASIDNSLLPIRKKFVKKMISKKRINLIYIYTELLEIL